MFCQIVFTGGFNAPLTVPQNLSRNLPLFHRERTFFLKDLVPDPLDILPQVQIRLLVDQINGLVVLDYSVIFHQQPPFSNSRENLLRPSDSADSRTVAL